MAAPQEPDYFPLGSTVQCVTCVGEKIDGEVVAFDKKTRLLALKVFDQTSTKKPRSVHMELINLNLVKDINVLQEAPPGSSQSVPPTNFNYNKITRRRYDEVDKKRRSVCPDSVSADGQKLFITIRKTIEEVAWDGECICVLSAVLVTPPYKSSNIQIKSDQNQQINTRAQAQNTAEHVKKITDQFWLKNEQDGFSSASNEKSKSRSPPPDSGDSKRSSS